MLNLLIVFNDGECIASSGWADRPIQQLMAIVHKTFDDVRAVSILSFTPT